MFATLCNTGRFKLRRVGRAQNRPISIGDSITLVDEQAEVGSRVDDNAGVIYSTQTLKPRLFVAPDKYLIDNFHGAVFEVLIPFEYRNKNELRRVVEEIDELRQKDSDNDKLQVSAKADKARLTRELQSGGQGALAEAKNKELVEATFKVTECKETRDSLDSQITSLEVRRKQLFKLAQSDDQQNAKEQKRQLRNPLKFGDVIQLKHKFSDKFMCVSASKSALIEQNAVRVFLQDYSNKSCFFKIMPRFKVRNEGEQVRAGDQIKITNESISGYALSRSSVPIESIRDYPRSYDREKHSFEVCLSAKNPAWKVGLYTSVWDGVDTLKFGDVIQIRDKEIGAVLSVAEMIRATPRMETSVLAAEIKSEMKTERIAYMNAGTDKDGGTIQEAWSFFQVYAFLDPDNGGPVAYSRGMRLRHLASGKFLAVNNQHKIYFVDENGFDPKAPNNDLQFCFEHGLQFGRSEYVTANAVIRLMSFHNVFFSTVKDEDNRLSFLDKATATQESAKSGEKLDEELFVDKSPVAFLEQTKFTYNDVVSISKVDEGDVDDFYYVNGLLPVIELAIRASSQAAIASLPSVEQDEKTFGTIRGHGTETAALEWSNGGRAVVEFATLAFEELATFVLDNDEDDDEWGKSQFARQGLLQDLGVLDKIVGVLESPLLGLNAFDPESVADPTMLGKFATGIMMNKGKDLFPEYQNGLENSEFGLWDMAFRTLSNASKGDESSTDRYLARHYKVFVNHMLFLKTDGAAEVLIELFEDNREAIDDLIKGTYEAPGSEYSSEKTAGGLGWILQKLEKNELDYQNTDFIDHDYYNFLSALCVCKELAVRTSQAPILDKMKKLGTQLADLGHFISIEENPKNKNNDIIAMFQSGRSDRAFSVKEKLIQQGTQTFPKDIETYYEQVQGDELNELRYDFLLSNLKICAYLLNGHWTGPEDIVRNLVNNKFSVLVSLAKNNEMTYAIRTRTLEIMLEMYLETQGNLTMLSDDKLELVYKSTDTRSGLGLDAEGLNANAAEETKEFNRVRAQYLLGRFAQPTNREKINWGRGYGFQITSRGSGSKKKANTSNQASDDCGFLGWVGYNDGGFRVDLRKFSREMCRLNKTNDTYEPWHQEHGEFVTAVLDQIYFACESGFFDHQRLQNEYSLDPAEVIHMLVRVLVEDLLFFASELINVGITATKMDEQKEQMIMNVLDKALRVLELLEIQQQFGALNTFIQHFITLRNSTIVKQGKSSTPELPDILKHLQAKSYQYLDYLQERGRDKMQLPLPPSDNVNDYLDALHKTSSIASDGVFDSYNGSELVERASLTSMLHSAYGREKAHLKEQVDRLLVANGGQKSKKRQGSLKTTRNVTGNKIPGDAKSQGFGEADALRQLHDIAKQKPKDFEEILLRIARRGRVKEDVNVVKRAVKFLTLIRSRKVKMFKTGLGVQILTDKRSLFVYDCSCPLLSKLHYMVYDESITPQNAKELTALLIRLTALLCIEDSGAIGRKKLELVLTYPEDAGTVTDALENLDKQAGLSASPKPVFALQVLLFKMNFLDTVLQIFDQDLNDKDVAPDETTGIETNPVIACMVAALRFIGMVAMHQDDAQDRVFDEMLGLFSNHHIEAPSVIAALAECCGVVFTSPKYQMKIRESQLNAIAERHQKTKSPELLRLFSRIVSVPSGSSPIARNQELIMSLLMKYRIIEYITGDTMGEANKGDSTVASANKMKGEGLARQLSMRTREETDKQDIVRKVFEGKYIEGWTEGGTRSDVLSAPRLLELLGALGSGSEVTLIESICKKIFSVDQILYGLAGPPKKSGSFGADAGYMLSSYSKKEGPVMALVSFFYATYLDSACVSPMRFDGVLCQDSRMWALIEHITAVVAEIVSPRSASPTQRQVDYAANVLLRLATGFFDNNLLTKFFIADTTVQINDITRLQAAVKMKYRDMTLSLFYSLHQLHTKTRRSPPWWLSEYDKDLLKTMGSILKALNKVEPLPPAWGDRPFQDRGQDSNKQRPMDLRTQASRDKLEKTLTRQRKASFSRPERAKTMMDKHQSFDVFDDEVEINKEFKIFCNKLWKSYGMDKAHEFPDCPPDKLEDCLYVEVDDDGETILPRGLEFQEYLDLLGRTYGDADGDTIESDTSCGMLLRYLGFLQKTKEDVGATDEAKEEATRLSVDCYDLLCALIEQERCQKFKYWPPDKNVGEQTNIRDKVKEIQTAHAEAGALKYCIIHIQDDEEDLMKAAFRYLRMLLDGGNVVVQKAAIEAFTKAKKIGCLTKIREEMMRALSTLEITSSNVERNETLELLQEQEHRWLIDLIEGLQAMCEGAFTELQDFLRDQSTISRDAQVNFVATLAEVLQGIFTKVGMRFPRDRFQGTGPALITQAKKQFDRRQEQTFQLVKAVLDAICEMCQGNQANQLQALDKRIISMISALISIDSEDERTAKFLMEVKGSALTVIEAMLEQSNAQAVNIAHSLKSSMNLEELYLAMNRMYYTALYRVDGSVSELEDEEEDNSEKDGHEYMAKARDCYHILLRLKDLTGEMYRWPKQLSAEVIDEDDIEALRKQTEKTRSRIEEDDKKVWTKFKAKLDFEEKKAKESVGKPPDGFELYCQYFLVELDDHGGDNLGDWPDRLEFFEISTRSIEFVRDGAAAKLYFPAPPKEETLSKVLRDHVLYNLCELESPQDKARSLLEAYPQITDTLARQSWLRSFLVTSLIAEDKVWIWKWLHLLSTYAINVCMLIAFYAPTDPYKPVAMYPDWYPTALYTIGTFHLLCTLQVVAIYYVNSFPSTASTDDKRIHEIRINRIKAMVPGSVYYTIFLACSVLGLTNDGYFFAFHVLHIVVGNAKLQRAVTAITRNGLELLMVSVLILSAVYIFSLIAFLFFRVDYNPLNGQYADTLYQTFTSTVVQGLTAGQGVQEVLEPGNSRGYFSDPHFVGRIIFDLLFWIMIPVIAMNLILGIIVDTFSELRTETAEKQEELQTKCYICSLPDYSFEQVPGGFQRHIRKQHNMWDYVYFMIRLEKLATKDITDLNYNEAYLYRMLVRSPDIKALPIKTALALKDTDDIEESIDDKLQQLKHAIELTMHKQFKTLKLTPIAKPPTATNTTVVDANVEFDGFGLAESTDVEVRAIPHTLSTLD